MCVCFLNISRNSYRQESSSQLTVFAIKHHLMVVVITQLTRINTAHLTQDYGTDCTLIMSNDCCQQTNTQMAKDLHQLSLAACCVPSHKSCRSSRENIREYARALCKTAPLFPFIVCSNTRESSSI